MDETQKRLLFEQIAGLLLKNAPCKSKQLADFDHDDGGFWGDYAIEYGHDEFTCRIFCYFKEGYIKVEVEPDFTHQYTMTDTLTGEEIDHNFDPPALDSVIDSMADFASHHAVKYKFYPEEGKIEEVIDNG